MFMHSESMRKNRVVFLFIILISLIVTHSCNVEKNRKILTFFFDGVPQKHKIVPADPKLDVSQKIDERPEALKLTVSIHPDFKTKNCKKCHDRSAANFLITSKKEICFKCHKSELFSGKYIHGPVAVKACTVCHDPHQSKNRKLLLESGRALCDLCHRIPVTNDPLPCKGNNCLECHDPHISNNKYFLKGEIN